jgi:hypothetical protein
MSKLKRISLPALLLLLFSAGCATNRTSQQAGTLTDLGPCISTLAFAPNPNAPIARVYLDASNRPAVDPDEIRANARNEHAPTQPVMIQWFAPAPQDTLNIRMKDAGCVTEPICNGFRCYAYTEPRDPKQYTTDKRCNYSVDLNGVITDPVVIIQPCCM